MNFKPEPNIFYLKINSLSLVFSLAQKKQEKTVHKSDLSGYSHACFE